MNFELLIAFGLCAIFGALVEAGAIVALLWRWAAVPPNGLA